MFEREFQQKTLISPVDGTAQRYFVRKGNANSPCAIVLHGHGSLGDQPMTRQDVAEMWTGYLVAHDFSIITPDLRGNAWMSEAAVADLTAIIMAEKPLLSWSKLLISAGSMGGTGALIFASIHPELIDGVAAFGAATDLEMYCAFLKTREHPVLREILEAIKQNYPTVDAKRLHSACRNAARLTMPVWYLHGGADEIIPVSEAYALVRLMDGRSNFHYREIECGNHDSPLPYYAETMNKLLQTLR